MIYLSRLMFLSLLIFNCIYGGDLSSQHVSPPYVEMAGKIRSEIAQMLAKRYNMKIFGISGGMADCVNMLGLDFQIQGPLPKEQLRRILIESVHELLEAVNSNQQIRPFLKNYPFTEKEIITTLFVIDKNRENVFDPEILVASSYHGRLIFNTKDKAVKYGYKQEIKEDYETALKIVLEENKKQH